MRLPGHHLRVRNAFESIIMLLFSQEAPRRFFPLEQIESLRQRARVRLWTHFHRLYPAHPENGRDSTGK